MRSAAPRHYRGPWARTEKPVMAPAPLHNVLAYLRRVTHPGGAGDRTDAELLRRLVAGRDEAAFEALLQRHGPMVLAVCRRVLANEADAEDAFQAVFLVLLRKAAAVHRHESVGSFLYGVALRTALRARSDLANRREHERHGAAMAAADPSPDPVWDDLRPVLDEEVARLPGKYREPFRLCYLEGKTYDEAAHALGCSKGTVSSRLTRARERLRRRLVGRGVTLSGGLLATLLAARAAPAAVPPPLLRTTLRAAVAAAVGGAGAAVVSSRVLQLTEGVVQSMSTNKLRIVGGFLLAACAVGVAGAALYRAAWAGGRGALPRDEAPARAEGVPAWQESARLGSAVGEARYAQFAPDGRTLATVDGKSVLRLWDTETWEQRLGYDIGKRYGDDYTVYTPFSPDSRLLALYGKVPDPDKPGQRLPEVTVLEVATGKEVARLPGRTSRFCFCPDGTAMVTWRNDTATLWDLPTYRKRFDLKAAAPLPGFAEPWFSKDGALLFTATTSGRAHLWETATGKERAQVEGYTALFAPDGQALATQLPGGVVKLWDTGTGRERAAFRAGGNTGLWPQFSADSRRLLTCPTFPLKVDGQPDLDGGGLRSQVRIRPLDIRLWDAATGNELARLPGMKKLDTYASFSPDGKTVAYARLGPNETDREEVVLWDVESGKERIVLRAPEGVRTASFSPDGKVLFTGDASGAHLKVWDPATGRRLPDVAGGTDAWIVAVSADSRLLAASPGNVDPGAGGSVDLIVYRLSDRPLPAAVRRGQPAPEAPPPTPPRAEEPRRTRAAQALADLRKERDAAAQEVLPKLQAAKTDAERKPLQDQFTESQARFAARALAIAREHSADPAAAEALEFALHTTSGGFGGATGKVRDEALDLIRKDFLRSPDLGRVLYFIAYQHTDAAYELLAVLAETSPHRAIRGQAAYVLAQELVEKAETVRLLRALPDLEKQYELQERAGLLEQLRKADPDTLDRQAEAWYARVKEKYADVAHPDAEPGTLGEAAERGLFALRHLGLGKTAPDIEGEDLDGQRFKLSEYRGRVVVLVFCGQWCGPCRALNPQEQRLVERLAGKPFTLLEVNSDEDREAVKRTMRKEKLTWRCWFEGGREGPIARRWNVHRWPGIYVLDAQGVIRYKDLRDQPLDEAVLRLLPEAGLAPKPGK
jgi:RNA polymerase sigma factor (sigma-70 family)